MCVWLSFALWIDKHACLGLKICMISVCVSLEYKY